MEPLESNVKADNKKFWFISLIILIGLILVGSFGYIKYFNNTNTPIITPINETVSTTTQEVVDVKKGLKHLPVDIEKENWPVSNKYWSEKSKELYWEVGERYNPPRFSYDDLYVSNNAMNSVVIKKTGKILISVTDDSSVCSHPISDNMYPNSSTGYLYLNCDVNHYGLWGLFNIFSEKIVSSSTLIHIYDVDGIARFSRDKTYLIYIGWRNNNITIFDLIDNDKKYEFVLPGDIKQFYKDRKIDSIKQNLYFNYLGSFKFTDSSNIEFSRYWVKLTDGTIPISGGYTQVSDKEIWSYNFDTKEFKLLKTIPLNPENTDS